MRSSPNHKVAMLIGYKQQWLSIRDRAPVDVANALGVKEVRPAACDEGLACVNGRSRDDGRFVYVTPALGRWTLAVGGLSGIPQAGNPSWVPFLENLSAKLGHVQYFGTHRVTGYVAWAKSEGGRLVRAYAYSGESDETLVNLGSPTPEEIELGMDFLDERIATEDEAEAHANRVNKLQDQINSYILKNDRNTINIYEHMIIENFLNSYDMKIPNESSVMLIAGQWSFDPTRREDIGAIKECGLLGLL